jgi:SAM-dependent methyltransferase
MQPRERLKRFLRRKWTTQARCIATGRLLPRWGNLRRLEPFSRVFGFDRGTPIDRFYLHKFLEQHQHLITGNILEIQRSQYTRIYGHNLGLMHTVDIDPQHGPTFVCDLAHCEAVLASNTYDCVLLPNTLHLLREVEASLRHVLRVTRPGGVILAAAAGFVPLDGLEDYWHLSPAGWREVLASAWPGGEIIITGHGNCLAVLAANLGLAVEELSAPDLDYYDPHFPVCVTVYCRKPLVEAGVQPLDRGAKRVSG